MECPYCGYHHGWDGKSNKDIEGREGEFFELTCHPDHHNIKMGRIVGGVGYWNRHQQTKNIMGCPKCFKLFMDPR
jgi:hypothetical protein